MRSVIRQINNLALKSPKDFDKYEALALAQELLRVAALTGHEMATLYSVSLQVYRVLIHLEPSSRHIFYPFLLTRNMPKLSSFCQRLTKLWVSLTHAPIVAPLAVFSLRCVWSPCQPVLQGLSACFPWAPPTISLPTLPSATSWKGQRLIAECLTLCIVSFFCVNKSRFWITRYL